MTARSAVLTAMVVMLYAVYLGGCGGPDLLVGSPTGNPTATAAATTPSPTGCSLVNEFCDNISTFCCSTGACNTFTELCAF